MALVEKASLEEESRSLSGFWEPPNDARRKGRR